MRRFLRYIPVQQGSKISLLPLQAKKCYFPHQHRHRWDDTTTVRVYDRERHSTSIDSNYRIKLLENQVNSFNWLC